jgi:ribA/ribD-fused uncharacterized protein
MRQRIQPTQANSDRVRGEVHFYRANDKSFGAFSNLFRRSISFEGAIYATAEHAYQAGKARTPAVRAWLMAAPTPALLAMAAHGLYYWDIAPDWSRSKFSRMRRVLLAKFTQHPDLAQLLLSTGHARLVETPTTDSPVNRTWGEVRGVGKNMLGRLLMEIREELRNPVHAGSRRSNATETQSYPVRRSISPYDGCRQSSALDESINPLGPAKTVAASQADSKSIPLSAPPMRGLVPSPGTSLARRQIRNSKRLNVALL